MKKVVITKAQVLHLVTVFIITPGAGFVTAWVAKNFPGLPSFTTGQVTAAFITGSGAALTAGIHYLHGWQLWERTVGKVVDVEDTPTPPATPPATLPPNTTGSGAVPGSPGTPVAGQPATTTGVPGLPPQTPPTT